MRMVCAKHESPAAPGCVFVITQVPAQECIPCYQRHGVMISLRLLLAPHVLSFGLQACSECSPVKYLRGFGRSPLAGGASRSFLRAQSGGADWHGWRRAASRGRHRGHVAAGLKRNDGPFVMWLLD